MKFIPKKSFMEGMAANPLDHSIQTDNDVTKLAQEGILTAVAAETDAINQYKQISDMVFKSEDWLKDLVGNQLTDIVNEEKKHLSQLSNIVSKLPNFKNEWDAGQQEANTDKDVSVEKESVNEAVEKGRTYEVYGICQLIGEIYDLDVEQYGEIEDLFNGYASEDDELTPEETDLAIHDFAERYKLTPEEVKQLEIKIMSSVKDPQKERIEDFSDDIENDIYYLQGLIEDEKISTVAAKEKIYDVINYLKAIEYKGEKDTGWRSEHSLLGNNTKRSIIS